MGAWDATEVSLLKALLYGLRHPHDDHFETITVLGITIVGVYIIVWAIMDPVGFTGAVMRGMP